MLLNSVDRDGMMQGYDLKLVKSVADGLTVPLIACGGARDAADLGRVLHEGHALSLIHICVKAMRMISSFMAKAYSSASTDSEAITLIPAAWRISSSGR